MYVYTYRSTMYVYVRIHVRLIVPTPTRAPARLARYSNARYAPEKPLALGSRPSHTEEPVNAL